MLSKKNLCLAPTRRKVYTDNTLRLSSTYDSLVYNCTFYAPHGERLTIYVQIPKGFEKANEPDLFLSFEELILCFNTISSLEMILDQLKLISWENTSLAASPKIELCAFKKVNGMDVLYLKILEKDGKRMEHIQPTHHGIMVVNSDKSWECYDEEKNFQVFCSDGADTIEVIGDTIADECRALSRILLFKNLAEDIYKQNF